MNVLDHHNIFGGFVVVMIVWKVIELWKLKNWATRTGGKIKRFYDERENLFDLVRDNVAHLKQLSHAVLGRGVTANTIEPAATAEEAVCLGELAREESDNE